MARVRPVSLAGRAVARRAVRRVECPGIARGRGARCERARCRRGSRGRRRCAARRQEAYDERSRALGHRGPGHDRPRHHALRIVHDRRHVARKAPLGDGREVGGDSPAFVPVLVTAKTRKLKPQKRFRLPFSEPAQRSTRLSRQAVGAEEGQRDGEQRTGAHPRESAPHRADTDTGKPTFDVVKRTLEDTSLEYVADRETGNPASESRLSVEARLQHIHQQSEFPALSVDVIDALRSMPEDEASLQRLANVVLREYSLTLKVIRTANSALYRRAGHKVQSATHAMLMLGARTVRHLASSLLLFEHYRRHSIGLKELMLLSLLSANHTREVVVRRRLVDPEEAHLCGMLRNLGEVLIACYFPADYARILAAMKDGRSESQAVFVVLGFTYEEMGEAMARSWGMPETVLGAMRSDGGLAASDLGMVTAFGHELTSIVYRREVTDFADAVSDLLRRYDSRLGLTKEDVIEVLESALTETRAVFDDAGVSIDDLRFRRQAEEAMVSLGRPRSQLTADAEGEEQRSSESDLRAQLLEELREVADPSSGEDLNRLLLVGLEVILRGGPFDRVVFYVVDGVSWSIRARFGLGSDVEGLVERLRFELSPTQGHIARAIRRRECLYVPTDRLAGTPEERWMREVGASSFGVFSLVVANKIVGGIYCDRRLTADIPDRDAVSFVRDAARVVEQGTAARRTRAAVELTASPKSVTPVRTSPRIATPAPPAPLQSTSAIVSADVRGAAVLRVLGGEAPDRVASDVGVSVPTLEEWRRAFMDGAMAALRGAGVA
jgi:HD-like signal output (HDOD) protein